MKTKLTETKLDSDRLKSLLLPGVTENSGRPPTQDEMSTLRFFLHLESGENSEDFIHTHRQLTGHLTHGKKFRLRWVRTRGIGLTILVDKHAKLIAWSGPSLSVTSLKRRLEPSKHLLW